MCTILHVIAIGTPVVEDWLCLLSMNVPWHESAAAWFKYLWFVGSVPHGEPIGLLLFPLPVLHD